MTVVILRRWALLASSAVERSSACASRFAFTMGFLATFIFFAPVVLGFNYAANVAFQIKRWLRGVSPDEGSKDPLTVEHQNVKSQIVNTCAMIAMKHVMGRVWRFNYSDLATGQPLSSAEFEQRLQLLWRKSYQETGKGLIIMCNHLSNADGYFLRGILQKAQPRVIYKGSLNDVPILSTVLTLSGDIPVHFGKAKGGWAVLNRDEIDRLSLEILNSGSSILVFPEGQRSKTGQLSLFRKGMFEFALKHSVDILPISMWGFNVAWPPGHVLVNRAQIPLSIANCTIRPDKAAHSYADLLGAVVDSIHISLMRFEDYRCQYDEDILRNAKFVPESPQPPTAVVAD